MLGATASLILGGLGMAANAVQAVQANKQKKEADAAAKQYAQDLKNVQEVNYMAGLQAPDIMSLQQEANARNTQMNIQAMQEMGAAGAAQAGNIVEANRQADLQAAQQQAVLEQQTQRQVLGTQQQIEGRRADREEGIALMGLEGAQIAGLQAQNQKASSIEGMFGAAGLMIGGADQAIGLYGNGGGTTGMTGLQQSNAGNPNSQAVTDLLNTQANGAYTQQGNQMNVGQVLSFIPQ